MAAGLTVRLDKVDALEAFLCQHMGDDWAEASAADAVEIDALISPRADRALYEDFQRLAPFGPGNPEPMFAMGEVMVEHPTPMRGGHLRCTLGDGAGGRMRSVAWRCEDTPLGQRLLSPGGALHVAGRLKPDDYQGRQAVQFEIDDAADPRMCG